MKMQSEIRVKIALRISFSETRPAHSGRCSNEISNTALCRSLHLCVSALFFMFRANCSEYFPIFITVLWTSGVFFSQGLSAVCGLLYLYGRFQYFRGYSQSAQGRLAPLYFSAQVLWVLIGLSSLGIFLTLCRVYLNVDLLQELCSALSLV
ncbi:leukotriene C4 synthase isoform X2 [Acanthopagrus latus]|uniref:leukotriene C4 synthase isoform X2 n=1 Tax=Acanthopagrus latus TaxID=8177 RepID=UPI00187CA68B|nr:leukotriene C4 synthase isoform X2 [Acanthopagrus latus]